MFTAGNSRGREAAQPFRRFFPSVVRAGVVAILAVALLLPSAAGLSRSASSCCCKASAGKTCPLQHRKAGKCSPSHGGCSLSRHAESPDLALAAPHVEIGVAEETIAFAVPQTVSAFFALRLVTHDLSSSGPEAPPPELV